MKANKKADTVWDVVVIGGGPAGMMAAGRAAERGRSVLLLEKNPTLGKKLLATGGGRCNVTNGKIEIRTMLAQYKGNGQFLFSAFSQFSVQDTLNFFNRRGMATKVEAEGRVFPVSNKAQSVWDVLVRYMKEGDVRIQTGAAVTGLSLDAVTKHVSIRLKDTTEIRAQSCVVATGGASRPETGSSGEGFIWLKKIGHTIIDTSGALVPIALTDAWAKKISGVTLKDIKLTVFQSPEYVEGQNGQKQEVSAKGGSAVRLSSTLSDQTEGSSPSKSSGGQEGKLLFTHVGISGPTVLNMSKEVGEMLQYGEVTIALDLFPKLDSGALKRELQTLLIAESNKKLKNTLRKLIPAALVGALLELANINGETANHSVRREDRIKLVALAKAIPLHVKGLLGADKAVVSSGGVALKEVNFKTMQSRLAPNLYVIGDVLNIDRPSGGYSLQLSWTTGFVAGSNS
ncbi:MAG: aminoacetone oxidase family FAD-binding enzyme [Patescibacteria group bacterium]